MGDPGHLPECNVYSWIAEDGRFVPSWATESFKDVVAAYRRLYETGGLDPEFYSKAPNTVMENFASGRLGALEYKSSPSSLMELKDKWDVMNDKPFEECGGCPPCFLPLPTVSVTAIPAVFSGLSPIFPQKLMTGSWNES